MLPMLLLLDLVLLQQMLDHAALMTLVMGRNLNYGTTSLCISVYQDQDLHHPLKENDAMQSIRGCQYV